MNLGQRTGYWRILRMLVTGLLAMLSMFMHERLDHFTDPLRWSGDRCHVLCGFKECHRGIDERVL